MSRIDNSRWEGGARAGVVEEEDGLDVCEDALLLGIEEAFEDDVLSRPFVVVVAVEGEGGVDESDEDGDEFDGVG